MQEEKLENFKKKYDVTSVWFSEKLAATIVYTTLDSDFEDFPVVSIDYLAVAKEFRGLGIGYLCFRATLFKVHHARSFQDLLLLAPW